MSIDALPRVTPAPSALKTPSIEPIDMTTACLPGGVYAALSIYAAACDNCTGNRPCTKHDEIMRAAYNRQFAATHGIDLGERPRVVPRGEPAYGIRAALGVWAHHLQPVS